MSGDDRRDPAPPARAAPRRLPSLRRRLAWAFVLLAVGVALAQALFLHWSTVRAEERLIDEILAGQLRRSVALYRTQPDLASPNTGDMTLYVVAAAQRSTLPPWLREVPLAVGQYELEPAAGVEYHVAVDRDETPEGERWFFLVYDVAEHTDRQRNSLVWLALSVAAVAVVALVTAERVAGRLVGDLERLSAAVRGVPVAPPGPPGPPLEPLAEHAESRELAQALDEQRRGLERAIERERLFSAAASHELRTPLTRASTATDLLAARVDDAQQRRLLGQVRDGLLEIRMLIEGLLRVLRGRTQRDVAPQRLDEVAAQAIAALMLEAQARGTTLRSEVPEGAVVAADRGALWIVLTNLLRNAVRHSGGSLVRVTWADGSLRVIDDGQGWAAGPREAGASLAPRPAAIDDREGLGLGLTIVEHICEAAGWRLRIEPGMPGGTVASVDFEAASGPDAPA